MPKPSIDLEIQEQGRTWLLPPYNYSLRRVANELNVGHATVHKWREQLKIEGLLDGESSNQKELSAEEIFAIVIETAVMTEHELAAYCRSNGLFVEQVKQWKIASIQAHQPKKNPANKIDSTHRADKKRIKILEKELARKEKALAETAALLVLREKFKCPLGTKRGRLTPLSERLKIVTFIEDAINSGATKTRACRCVGISIRTMQRWVQDGGQIVEDLRNLPKAKTPHNKLTAQERQDILDVCNAPEYADLPPNVIVPMLADKGIYIASESTFYRVLKEHSQLKRRGGSASISRPKPKAQKAIKPNQVWSWDISYLPSITKGEHYYLYVIMDIFSRKIVGAEVFQQELGEHAADLLQRTTWKEKCVNKGLVLHSDNGAPMRSYTMLAKMNDLGVMSSYSRPRVSNDNPYSESLFKTVKCIPSWPVAGFRSIEEARKWVGDFTYWYNFEHKHSGIKYVTPQQRHTGEDHHILEQRKLVYRKAQATSPGRWRGQTRDWSFIDEVFLNPENKAA
ncbi:IS3 family transposase [Vibrio fluvialis]|nr:MULTISPECIES: IS3 family transposase [Vibrio]MCE7641240.1 IS3 family transposase [Vibrio fluvialis]